MAISYKWLQESQRELSARQLTLRKLKHTKAAWHFTDHENGGI